MGHKHQTTDASRIKRLLELETEGFTMEELAEQFGVTKGAIKSWLATDVAPFWTRCACEALERRLSSRKTQVVLCEFPRKDVEWLVILIKTMGGRIYTSFTSE